MANGALIRDIHQVGVLTLIRRHGSTSRARLAQDLGLTRSTVSSLISELTGLGYVTGSGKRVIRHGTGRPGVGLMLNPNGAFFVGADINYGTLRVVLLNLAAEVVARAQRTFDMSDRPEKVHEMLTSLIAGVLDRNGVSGPLTKGIGIAVPGTVVDGNVVLSPALGWSDVELRGPIQQEMGYPVLVENDANAAALGELHFQAHEQVEDLVYIHLGKGIGSGVAINGEIYRGKFGAAGEIGNMRLAPEGPRDSKGNRGTFEAFASMGSMMRRYREHGGRSLDLEGIVDELGTGQAAAMKVVEEWRHWVEQAVLMLVNVLNPQKIVFGGPLTPLVPAIMAALTEKVRTEQLPGSDQVEIVVSTLGEDSNAIGGAMSVYQKMFSLPNMSVARRTSITDRPAAAHSDTNLLAGRTRDR